MNESGRKKQSDARPRHQIRLTEAQAAREAAEVDRVRVETRRAQFDALAQELDLLPRLNPEVAGDAAER